MLDEENTKTNEESVEQQDSPVIWDDENLVNAFDLLLRIDMRINPQLYKPNQDN